MAGNNNYKSGAWWVICDSCSQKTKSDEAKHRWDGFIVCPQCYEMRHPQDFVRSKMDKITVPFTRPRPLDVGIFSVGAFDTLSWSDSLVLSRIISLSLADTLSWSESTLISKSVNLDDSWSFSDSLLVDKLKALSDNFILSDTVEKQLERTLTDSLTYSESLSAHKSVTLTDETSLTDQGTITLPIYAYDYFAEDYTQSTLTF